VKSLILNKDIRTLQTDEGKCIVVLDQYKNKYKLNTLLEPVVYEHLLKNPTAKLQGKYLNSFPNSKLLFLLI
jgi:hypothetical protein